MPGESYTLELEQSSTIDSAGLAYIANLISLQRQRGGDMTLAEIPESMQQLITLAELEFVFESQN